MNRIILCGRLTRDCETNDSGKVASNSIAVDRRLKDSSGNTVTDFINLRWIGEAKTRFADNYLKKGTKVIVEGSLQIDRYQDQSGNNKISCYVLVDNTEFAESKRSGSADDQPKQDENGFMNIPDGIDDELPFP